MIRRRRLPQAAQQDSQAGWTDALAQREEHPRRVTLTDQGAGVAPDVAILLHVFEPSARNSATEAAMRSMLLCMIRLGLSESAPKSTCGTP